MSDRESRNAGQVIPPPIWPPIPIQGAEYATSELIPQENGPALTAYYLGVFSAIPVIGLVLGLAALVLGIMGLRMAARQPEVKGKVQAWVGIIVGGFFGLGYLALAVLLIVGY